jgi:ATP-dependent helicase HrpB
MSATLGGGLATRVATLMGRALSPAPPDTHTSSNGAGSQGTTATSAPLVPIVTSEGRSYPVKVVYLGK